LLGGTMNETEKFQREVQENIHSLGADPGLFQDAMALLEKVTPHRYSYNFSWMGRPIIQLPQDIIAMQELIWKVKPKFIVETGVAHGGSAVFYASMLELLGGDGKVIAIDIDIRAHNRAALESHPMFKRIELLQGSSISPEILAAVKSRVQGNGPVI